MIQELLDAVQVDTEMDYSAGEDDPVPAAGQDVMAIQSPVIEGTTVKSQKKNRTLRLRGIINSHEVLILLDSGSAGTFDS